MIDSFYADKVGLGGASLFATFFTMLFIIILIVVFIVALVRTLSQEKADKIKKRNGDRYEEKVFTKLSKLFGEANSFKPILARGNHQTAEIDMVFVSRKGVFCVETKSKEFSSNVTGNVSAENWTFFGSEPLRNPFWQNERHIRFLRNNIREHRQVEKINVPENIPFYNIVILNFGFEFKYFGIERFSKKTPVLDMRASNNMFLATTEGGMGKNLNRLYSMFEALPDVLTDDEVNNIIQLLILYKASPEELAEHVSRLKEAYE